MDGGKVAALTALRKLVDDRLRAERAALDADMEEAFELQGVERAAQIGRASCRERVLPPG